MADTIEIAGHKVNKWLAYGGGAAVVVVAIVVYRKKQAAAAAASSASSGTDTSSSANTSSAGIDPETGYPYGSPQDQAALQAMGSGYGYGYGYGGGYGDTSGPLPTTTSGSYTTNAQWSQAAEQYLGSDGTDAIAAALAKYISGQPVNSDQQTIIEEAIAIAGYPPVNGPNGFPPSIDLTSGGGGGGKATNPVTGLTATSDGYTGIDLSWNASNGATGYLITAVGPGASPAFKTTATTARVRNLKPGTTYDIRVRAQPGGTGGTDAHVTVKTK